MGYRIGIDIGSTAAKAAVVDEEGLLVHALVMPTGYSSVDAAERLRASLVEAGYDPADEGARCVATGYGRIAVPFADSVVTEITCHGAGAAALFGPDGVVVDIGG